LRIQNTFPYARALQVAGQGELQQVEVRVVLGSQLADDRRTPEPELAADRPLADDRLDVGVVLQQDRPDLPRRDVVDDIPPGTGHDEVAVQRQRRRVLVRAVVTVARECQRGVPLLAMGRVVPEQTHCGLPVRA